jgi:hypothetical protein
MAILADENTKVCVSRTHTTRLVLVGTVVPYVVPYVGWYCEAAGNYRVGRIGTAGRYHTTQKMTSEKSCRSSSVIADEGHRESSRRWR